MVNGLLFLSINQKLTGIRWLQVDNILRRGSTQQCLLTSGPQSAVDSQIKFGNYTV